MSILLYANFLGRIAALSASQSVDPDYPLANLVDEARDTCARIQSTADQYIQFDINAANPPCDFFFLDRGHNLDGATARLMGSDVPGFSPEYQLFSQNVSGDGAIFKTFSKVQYEYFRLHLENLTVNPSIFGVYFGESASLSKYPIGPCRPDTVRAEKEIQRFESGRKRQVVHYTEHRLDYEWPRVDANNWPWFGTLETETEYLTRPFWLKWESHHNEPIFFISEDDRLDWNYVDGVNRQVRLTAEEYL